MSLWVADSSPLIFLAKLSRLDLLRKEAEGVLVPPAVLREIAGQDDEAAFRVEEARRTWLQVRPLKDLRLSALLKRELGDGEAEAIALALENDAARIVLDDLDARRLADRLGLKVVGTLGLLLAAKLRGEIPSLRAEIDRLRRGGFRAGSALVEEILRSAGEEDRK
jgi:predicted nucleic acid-binding protein